MLIGIKIPLKDGDTVPIMLELDDGSSQEVTALVKNPLSGSSSPEKMTGHQH